MIGRELAKALIHSGVKVAVFDIAEPPESHELLEHKSKSQLGFYTVDITKKESVEKALQSVIAAWGVPSALINSAAIDFPPTQNKTAFEDYPLAEWQKTLDVNLTGTVICCQVVGGAMAKRGHGSIVNIGSTYGLVSPDQRIYKNFLKPVSYSVTKSGILNLTRYLATYWADKNIRVNTLTPGGIKTDQDLDFIDEYEKRVPLGRMARKDEYNAAVLFLASDASSYMTGANLIIDGGWTAW